MIEQDLRVESKSGVDVAQHPYYKKLSNELKAKRSQQTEERLNHIQKQQEKQLEEKHYEDKVALTEQRNQVDDSKLHEDIKAGATDWAQKFEEAQESQQKQPMSDQAKAFIDNMKHDGKKIVDYLGHKINFFKRLPDLKEMFKHNLMQSKSHNFFMAKFADFKVGVVGQILSYMGMPIEELKKLRQDALKEAFEENIELMSQNIYNIELAELVHGRSRKSRKSLQRYNTFQTQLVQNMENIGRKGYWSKTRLLEEKIKQLDKIYHELRDEMSHLEYQREYLEQVEE